MRFHCPSCFSAGAWLFCCGILALGWIGGCAGDGRRSTEEPGTGGAGQLGSGGSTSRQGSGGSTTPLGSGGTPATGGSSTVRASGGRAGTGGSLGLGGAGTGGIAVGGSGGSGAGGSGAGGSGSGGSGSGGSGSGGNTRVASGGATGTGGRIGGAGGSGVGGVTTSGGAAGGSRTGGSGGGSGNGGTTGSTGVCGGPINQHPFGCKFGWGIADPGGSLASYSYLQLVSYWVDSSISAAGTYSTCGACSWLTSSVASTNLIPAYYAYIIGFLGHANGIVDGNQSGSRKLTTDGAQLIKDKRAAIISAYAWYAEKTAAAWPSKPLVWLLEGDFVQYAASSQSSPLTWAELGQLAEDITCAIKSKMPNAVVAVDHSSWNDDATTNNFWGAMKNVDYDMVWTTGVGNANGFISTGTTATSYNGKTATYAYIHNLTGRTILVDTSAGASAAGDSWSTIGVGDLNARIAEGVIAANITGTRPSNLQSNVSGLAGANALPGCP